MVKHQRRNKKHRNKIRVYLVRGKKKKDIAFELLDSACREYERGKYCSCLHLAGASEEIFGKFLETRGIPNSLKSEVEGLQFIYKHFYGMEKSYEDAREIILNAKNSIKHMNDLSDAIIHADLKREAEDMLCRAFTNLWRMEEDLSPYQGIWDSIEGRK